MHEGLPFDEASVPSMVSTGELPEAEQVRDVVTEAYEQYRSNTAGTVADYIPALATASPDLFGISGRGQRLAVPYARAMPGECQGTKPSLAGSKRIRVRCVSPFALVRRHMAALAVRCRTPEV